MSRPVNTGRCRGPRRQRGQSIAEFLVAMVVIGPLLLGTATALFHSQRAGIATIIPFFVIGALLLRKIPDQQSPAANTPETFPPSS